MDLEEHFTSALEPGCLYEVRPTTEESSQEFPEFVFVLEVVVKRYYESFFNGRRASIVEVKALDEGELVSICWAIFYDNTRLCTNYTFSKVSDSEIDS